MTAIHISQLYYTIPSTTLSATSADAMIIPREPQIVFSGLSLSFPIAKIGLVGDNGSGKSTLLKLITEELIPDRGTIKSSGKLAYLSQNLIHASSRTVADLLGISPYLTALHAIETGIGSESDFALMEGNWDFINQIEVALAEIGLTITSFNQPLNTLSGGQLVLLNLIKIFSLQAEIILLDEPTNNLDQTARHWLSNQINNFHGCVIVASHDRTLLNEMNYIAELYQGNITLYQGNYSHFYAQRTSTAQTIEHQIKNASKLVKQEKRELQVAVEKSQKSLHRSQANRGNVGLPKILLGARKRSAEVSQGKKRNIHNQRIAQAQENLISAKNSTRMKNKLDPIFPIVKLPTGKPVLTAFHANAQYDGNWIFQPPGLHMSIIGAQKISLTGANGSGKSSLFNLIMNKIPLKSGELTVNRSTTALISQNLDNLNPRMTVEENLQFFNQSLDEQKRRNILAHFLFRKSDSQKIVAELSGGELVRAHLACILFQTQAPTLLLLDEPTNNLDITSTDHIITALRSYRGALIVISHDEYFLSQLSLDRLWELTGGILQEKTVEFFSE